MREIESSSHRAFCEECYLSYRKDIDDTRNTYIKLKKRLMVERAIRILEEQKIDIEEYKDAIDAVSEFSSENMDKFDSAHEVVAAIILVYNEVETKIQHKIGKYRADFLLPEFKIVLEIDGYLHESKLFKDNERDINIRNALGRDWEVVRIKTEYLEQNAELLLEAAKAVKNEKQKIRKQNFGILPEWYSKRESAKRPKKQKYGDEFLLDLDIDKK